jgi:cell division protein ZapA
MMATVELEIAGRKYAIACRDGEEEHLREVGAIVHRKAREAEGALGSLGEARQLLFASLLLADELKEVRDGNAPAYEPEPDPAVGEALERVAEQLESLAQRLENGTPNA